MCIAAKKEIQASCVFYTMRKKGDRVTWSAVRRFIRLGNSITYTMYIPSVATANDWRTIDWNGLLEIKNKHKQNENKIFKYPSVRFFLILCPGSIGRDGWWKDKQKGNIYRRRGDLVCTALSLRSDSVYTKDIDPICRSLFRCIYLTIIFSTSRWQRRYHRRHFWHLADVPVYTIEKKKGRNKRRWRWYVTCLDNTHTHTNVF